MAAEGTQSKFGYSPTAADLEPARSSEDPFSAFVGLLVAVSLGLTLWGAAFLAWWLL